LEIAISRTDNLDRTRDHSAVGQVFVPVELGPVALDKVNFSVGRQRGGGRWQVGVCVGVIGKRRQSSRRRKSVVWVGVLVMVGVAVG